ncbi:hypothetical protein KSP39_PZI010414 [Platanthera zijinensis]|uniref:Uncharacterized protein n=1 Tax=Platanthera zijinensis TaxID=2320716 RepID=A0AAP0G715_9ASPA
MLPIHGEKVDSRLKGSFGGEVAGQSCSRWREESPLPPPSSHSWCRKGWETPLGCRRWLPLVQHRAMAAKHFSRVRLSMYPLALEEIATGLGGDDLYRSWSR